MPNTDKHRAKPAPKPQTTQQQSAPKPTAADQSLFVDAAPAPAKAEPAPVARAAPSEASTVSRPEGAGGSKNPAQSSGEPEEVRLGQAIGLLHRMPLGSVLSYAEDFAEKIEAMRYAVTVQDLLPRMRVTEGRCAPIYFTMDDDGEPEHLIAGDDALAAAKAIPLDTVFVVLVHPGDAQSVHAYLNQKASTTDASTEDDELVWRAHHDAS
jgi:hypothetical protein